MGKKVYSVPDTRMSQYRTVLEEHIIVQDLLNYGILFQDVEHGATVANTGNTGIFWNLGPNTKDSGYTYTSG